MRYYPSRILNIKFYETVHEKGRIRKWKMSGRLGKEGEAAEKVKEKIEFKESETEANKRRREGRRRWIWVSKGIKMRKIR